MIEFILFAGIVIFQAADRYLGIWSKSANPHFEAYLAAMLTCALSMVACVVALFVISGQGSYIFAGCAAIVAFLLGTVIGGVTGDRQQNIMNSRVNRVVQTSASTRTH